MSSTHSIEVGLTVEVLIEHVSQDRVRVRLPDGSAGIIYRREWALDDPSQSPDEIFKTGTHIRATVLFFHRDSSSWELSLRRAHARERAARCLKEGSIVHSQYVGRDRMAQMPVRLMTQIHLDGQFLNGIAFTKTTRQQHDLYPGQISLLKDSDTVQIVGHATGRTAIQRQIAAAGVSKHPGLRDGLLAARAFN